MPAGIAITLPPYESGESIRERSHSQEKSESRKPSPDKVAYRRVEFLALGMSAQLTIIPFIRTYSRLSGSRKSLWIFK